jgi:molybdopterin biosynthesis enzyme
VANVGGVFVVLISGGGVAIFVAILEMLYDVYKRAIEIETSFFSELKYELTFIFKCHGNTKEVRRKKTESAEGSMDIENESRSASHSTCSLNKELTNSECNGLRRSIKALEKLDLMTNHDGEEQKV